MTSKSSPNRATERRAGHARALAFLALWVGGASLAACGPSYPESEYPPTPPAGVTPPEDEYAPAPPGAIWRRDLNAAIDAGLGTFLQKVELEPELQQGNFIGFRIVELRPPSWWQGVDLQPGDVVTQVNGMPIEQPTQAHAAFESLRTADKLSVRIIRGGDAREVTYMILDKPLKGPSGAAPAAETPEPAAPAPTPTP